MVERAHFTSAKFSEDESEFHHCNFDEEYIKGFNAPFVKESKVNSAAGIALEPIE